MKTIIKNIPSQATTFDELMFLHGFDGKIPARYIINKVIPGIGGTRCEILSSRHSIIIVPFTAIIEVKKREYGDLLAVQYGESEIHDAVEELLKYLNDKTIESKKIMTTPESFYKVKLALELYNTNYINDFFMLVDECDVFVADAQFRKKMLDFLPDFFSFTNNSMISATPHIPTDPRFDENGFAYLKFEPDFKLENELSLIITNNVNSSARDIIDYHNKTDKQPFFIFTNCKKTITYLIKLTDFKDKYRVFCSESLKDSFFAEQGINQVFSTIDEQEYSLLNAFTGRYFAGVDMWLDKGIKPNVIMISNVNETPHSIIHPNYTAIQIFGRCRRGVNSITHITTLLDKPYYDEQDIKETISNEIYLITELRKIKNKLAMRSNRKLIDDVMEKNKGFDMFNNDGTINTYSKDNYLYSALTENLYTNSNALLKEYEKGKFFKVKVNKVYKAFTEEDQLKLISKKKPKEKAIEVFQQLHKLIEEYGIYYGGKDYFDYYKHLDLLNKKDPLVFDGYFVLGAEKLCSLKWKRSAIRDAVNLKKHIDIRNNVEMIDEIINSFYCGPKVYITEIEKTLNLIYKRFDYRDIKGNIVNAKGTDIEDCFNFKRINGKVKIDGVYQSYYILFSPKYRTSDDYRK